MATTKVTYTPGPWKQDTLLVKDEHGVVIAHFTRWEGRSPRPEVAEKNAQLATASPDLLKELFHLVRLIEPYEHEGRIPGLATLNAARAAIQKAVGE